VSHLLKKHFLGIPYVSIAAHPRHIQEGCQIRTVEQRAPKETSMNWDQVISKWEQLMGSATENWGKLSDDDLQQISGKRQQFVAKIQETYGIARREAEKQVWDWGKSVERTQKKMRKYSCIPLNQAGVYPNANGLNVETTKQLISPRFKRCPCRVRRVRCTTGTLL
jgi:uncharacterized protein YjbJ (UPF0337 family)